MAKFPRLDNLQKNLPFNKLLNMNINKIYLYDLSEKMVQIGYYTRIDQIRFLEANDIKIF